MGSDVVVTGVRMPDWRGRHPTEQRRTRQCERAFCRVRVEHADAGHRDDVPVDEGLPYE